MGDNYSGYVFWKKYTNYDTQTEEDYNSGINFRVLRLADVYLMQAEALNELSRTAEAYPFINKVRNRAGLSDLELSSVFTGIGNDQTKMREQIKHERACELTGEATRWFDLVRWGELDDDASINKIATERDADFLNFDKRYHKRFPIPYREVPLVPITQNLGY
jgi:hypothetical protein